MTDDFEQAALPLRRCEELFDYPLSLMQEDVWLQYQLYPESDIYKLSVELSISGPLDVNLFSRAFQAAVDRHEALRTTVDEVDGTPVQRVLRNATASLPVIDLSAPTPEAKTAQRISRTQRLLSAPFEVAGVPLFRSELLRFDANDHHFTLVFHRLILDGFHAAQFVEEVARTYFSYRRGKSLPVPLKFQYGDFAVWQRQRLRTGIIDAHTDYWRRQLQEPLPETLLPTDHPIPVIRTYRVGPLARSLDSELCGSLCALEKPCRTTLFRIVLTALAVLLARLCGESEVLLAVPFSTRPKEMSGTLGFFSNPVPLRIDLRGDPAFTTLLVETSSRLRDGAAHKEFSLSELWDWPQEQKRQSRPRLPVLVSQVGAWDLTGGEARMSSAPAYNHATIYDLCLGVTERRDSLDLYYLYAIELFERSTVARWAALLEELLAEVACRPDAPLSCLESLPKASGAHASHRKPPHQAAPERSLAPPRTELERQLVAIWQETLGCSAIGIDDNLLQLGAHSLVMAKVHRKLKTLLADLGAISGDRPTVKLSLRALFDNPTIRALAALLDHGLPERAAAEESASRFGPEPNGSSL